MRRLAAMILIVAIGACAPRTGASGGPGSASMAGSEGMSGEGSLLVSAPPARVLEALPTAYELLGIPGALLDPAAMVFGVQQVELPRRVGGRLVSSLVDCGSGPAGPNAALYQVTVDVMTMVAAADSGATKVETRVQGYAQDRTVRAQPVRCSSNGVLEEMIAEQARRRRVSAESSSS